MRRKGVGLPGQSPIREADASAWFVKDNKLMQQNGRGESIMTASEKIAQITAEPNYEKKLELVDELTGEEAKEILKLFIRFQNRSEQ